ncbi:uncharacterized protein LAESUDRAFT_654686 [Laetiporus sulphureus 93-53]|uniref:Uncharacterized protein n=1 Tax=Laetiporus sulphureus 93-53 TaxID=1314785 RepID=A0A165DYP1_9APHY|nr:uncharacterized protein LAESUDRAFT_654686 [Laetiporus sulphureus 93-53]KZT05899.1 hypothetical protein LAESUDRAFT_654686 [Laetiporus sulphureus 93-53]
MSGRILQQVRLTHSVRFAAFAVPRRRCYSSLALKTHTPDVEQNVSEPVAGSSYESLTEARRYPNNLDTRLGADAAESSERLDGGSKKSRQKGGKNSEETSEASWPNRLGPKPSKVEEHLASLSMAGMEPTLCDLENCRPETTPTPDSPEYATRYNALVDLLCRSFSRKQLRGFLEERDPTNSFCSSKRRKVQYAESIIEFMWDWPSLKDIEREKRDRTEVSVQSFPVTASELFLLLGKDGADLLDMSFKYNVHIALAPGPLSLRVEGLRDSLKTLAEEIHHIKQTIVQDTFQLPTRQPVRSDMIQRISRLAGAYLENISSEGTIRMYSRNARNLEIAKWLASRAGYEFNQDMPYSRLAYIPTSKVESEPPVMLFPSTYSLYPFLSPRPLPWTMNTSGAFRVRRVSERLGGGYGEDIQATGGLAGEKGRIFTMAQDAVGLRDMLFSNLPGGPLSLGPSSRVVKASMGHVLITTTSPGQHASLVPPLQGNRAFSDILKWMADDDIRSSFVPSLPTVIVDTIPSHQQTIHRLLYHAISSPDSNHSTCRTRDQAASRVDRILCYEITLASPRLAASEPAPDSAASETPSSSLDGTTTSEALSETQEAVARETPTGPAEETASEAPSESTETAAHELSLITRLRCWAGVQTEVDLMMPDRPMDMKLTALESTTIESGQEPLELRDYVKSFRAFTDLCNSLEEDAAQPDPPLRLDHGGQTFILHTSASVRRSVEDVRMPDKRLQPGNAAEPLTIRIVSESISDLESNQKSTQCEITCDNHTSEEGWKRFLGDCDMLTSSTYRPIGVVVLEQDQDVAL